MKKIFIPVVLFPAIACASPVDFSKITHWTGDGDNRAAIVVQFNTPGHPFAYVWGYRWDNSLSPTGEDMFKAICANSPELVMLTQYTGVYGATLCGVGFGNADKIIENLNFDFDMARNYEWINFDYYSTNSWFGQAKAPGDNSPAIAQAAILAAAETHVVQHPFDYFTYGYPAYDYDCWKLSGDTDPSYCWISGWYEGYWSYWLSSDDTDNWMYSGTGFSGRILSDGAVDGWSYTTFDIPGIGGFGEGIEPAATPELISYRPANPSSAFFSPNNNTSADNTAWWYSLTGTVVAHTPDEAATLTPGIYIVRRDGEITKIQIR